jgi:hypothetical protein
LKRARFCWKIVDLTEISVIIATAGVLVGVVYYIVAIRNQAQTKQTDLVMRLYATFSTSEFQDAWTKVRKRAPKADIADIDEFDEKVGLREFNQVCLFFEGIGILLQRKLVDARMVEDLFGGSVDRAWGYVRKAVYRGRQQMNDPTIYYYFEYLYNEMKKREQKAQS